MTYLFLGSGLLLLFVGGEALVRGSVDLARRFGLSALLIGMVVAGFGTSMPEMVVSVYATIDDQPAIAVGNVFGSNIANILLILGLAALVRPIPSPPALFRWDGIMLLGATAAVVLLAQQRMIPGWQGALMIAGLGGYLYFQFQRERRARRGPAQEGPADEPSAGAAGDGAGDGDPPLEFWKAIAIVAGGLVALIGGGHLFVDGAVGLARQFGISEALIGLTIVAVGTSLPELATSLVAAWRRQSDIAYGNIIGSNLFNGLAILGGASFAGRIEVAPDLARIDGPVMFGATLLMLIFMATGRRMIRWEGAALVGLYAIYVAVRASA